MEIYISVFLSFSFLFFSFLFWFPYVHTFLFCSYFLCHIWKQITFTIKLSGIDQTLLHVHFVSVGCLFIEVLVFVLSLSSSFFFSKYRYSAWSCADKKGERRNTKVERNQKGLSWFWNAFLFLAVVSFSIELDTFLLWIGTVGAFALVSFSIHFQFSAITYLPKFTYICWTFLFSFIVCCISNSASLCACFNYSYWENVSST